VILFAGSSIQIPCACLSSGHCVRPCRLQGQWRDGGAAGGGAEWHVSGGVVFVFHAEAADNFIVFDEEIDVKHMLDYILCMD
jgi:hypothetical protein